MRSSFTLLAVVLLGAGCSSSASNDFEFDSFDLAVESYMAERSLEGAVAVVVTRDDGVIHLKGYGAFDEGRVFYLASTSKILSAGILMRLADQGLLDIDAPIANYLGDWGSYKTDITTAQLLSNSSGMPVDMGAIPVAYYCQWQEAATLSACGEAIYAADDVAASVPPDTEWRYGGAQWQLAGSLAEVVSGKTWAELFDETYGAPCGLEASGYHNPWAFAGAYPPGHDGTASSIGTTDNPSIEGGGFATAADYAQILLMHLRGGMCEGGRVLSTDAVERMQEDHLATWGGSTPWDVEGYGMGWYIDRDRPIVVASGAFGARAWLDLDRGYGALLLVAVDSNVGGDVGYHFGRATKPEIEEILDAR